MSGNMSRPVLLTGILILGAFSAVRSGETGGAVDMERAREIALSQTGGGEVVNMGRKPCGDGIDCYRFEIVAEDGRYRVEVDSSSGRLVRFIHKGGGRYRRGMDRTDDGGRRDGTRRAGGGISWDEAVRVALERTDGGVVIEGDVDRHRGGRKYEFEIVNDGMKYEIEIDGNGDVIEFEREPMKYRDDRFGTPRLDIAAAGEIALERAGGGRVVEYELDVKRGRLVHKFEVAGGDMREVRVDDETGEADGYSR